MKTTWLVLCGAVSLATAAAPVASNDADEGRAKNRPVELVRQ